MAGCRHISPRSTARLGLRFNAAFGILNEHENLHGKA